MFECSLNSKSGHSEEYFVPTEQSELGMILSDLTEASSHESVASEPVAAGGPGRGGGQVEVS